MLEVFGALTDCRSGSSVGDRRLPAGSSVDTGADTRRRQPHVVTQARHRRAMSTKRRGRVSAVQRKDPPTRAPDGSQPWGKIRNPDPAMHYVCVDPGNPLHGVDYYEQLGYEQVVRTEGGPRFVMGGKKAGDGDGVLSQLGQVLMQIPKGDPEDPQPGTKAFLDAPGQAHADAMEERIVDKRKGGVDGLRGMGRYFGIANETSRSFVEGRG